MLMIQGTILQELAPDVNGGGAAWLHCTQAALYRLALPSLWR